MNPIIPRVAGYVSKGVYQDNDFVKEGRPLFTIDNNDYELKLMKQPPLAAASNFEVSKCWKCFSKYLSIDAKCAISSWKYRNSKIDWVVLLTILIVTKFIKVIPLQNNNTDKRLRQNKTKPSAYFTTKEKQLLSNVSNQG
jgi:multidrug resistance efflux pump